MEELFLHFGLWTHLLNSVERIIATSQLKNGEIIENYRSNIIIFHTGRFFVNCFFFFYLFVWRWDWSFIVSGVSVIAVVDFYFLFSRKGRILNTKSFTEKRCAVPNQIHSVKYGLLTAELISRIPHSENVNFDCELNEFESKIVKWEHDGWQTIILIWGEHLNEDYKIKRNHWRWGVI